MKSCDWTSGIYVKLKISLIKECAEWPIMGSKKQQQEWWLFCPLQKEKNRKLAQTTTTTGTKQKQILT